MRFKLNSFISCKKSLVLANRYYVFLVDKLKKHKNPGQGLQE